MNFRTILAVIAGLILTVFFIIFFVRNISFDLIKTLFRTVHLPILLLAITAQASVLWIRSTRWRFLVYPSELPLKPFFEATTLSFLVTTILPGRLGEAMRPYVLFKRSNLTISKAIVSSLYERWMDLVALLLFALLYAFLEERSISIISKTSLLTVTIILVLGIAGAVWAILVKRKNNSGIFIGKIIDSIHGSLGFWRYPKVWGLGFAWTIILWGVAGLALFLASLSFDVTLGLSSTLLLILLVAFGSAVPTPAGIGGVQMAFVVVFSLIGIKKDTAMAIGLISHGALLCPTIIIGLFLLVSGRVPISSLLFKRSA